MAPAGAPLDESRVLGLDLGERRIGVAVSDPTNTLATPLETLTRRIGRRPPWRALENLARGVRAERLVVGLPLDPEGRETPWSREVRRVGDELARRLAIPVEYQDERYSSVRAEQLVRGSGLRKRERERKDRIDAAAAALILQDWLDARRAR